MSIPRVCLCRRGFASAAASVAAAASTMQAWTVHGTAPAASLSLAERLRVPSVRAASGVLVQVHAASVNPIDVHMLRDGYGDRFLGLARRLRPAPEDDCGLDDYRILGRDFSGVVAYVGEAVTTGLAPGDEVCGATLPFRRTGAFAEYIAVDETSLVRKPARLSHVAAASLAYAGLTALTALSGLVPREQRGGRDVLIAGASGGVGLVAVQTCVAWGHRVTALVPADAVDRMFELGCTSVVARESDDWLAQLATTRFNTVIDCVGAIDPSMDIACDAYVTLKSPLLRNTDAYGVAVGAVCTATDFVGNSVAYARRGSAYRWCMVAPSAARLRMLFDMADRGTIRPIVHKRFAFSDVPTALDAVGRGGLRGKVVVEMPCGA